MNEYQSLLKEWIDALLNLQIKGTGSPHLDGGIVCPACASVHGRAGDMVYALVYMYSITGEKKYMDAADALFAWTEKNMIIPGGGYRNGAKSNWTGITVFAAIAYGKTLLEHREDLGEERYALWFSVLKRLSHFLDEYFKVSMPNINYAMSYTAELAIMYRLTGDEWYKAEGRRWYEFSREKFSPEGIIFGEGIPMDLISERGCRSIDIGYNVEESLPNLVLYAKLTDDEDALRELIPILRAHLEFMLPDGAWDNSFGSRFIKWTYWGSRTADGCQTAYVLLSDRDEVFGEAAYRNYQLYRRCTVNGLLAGGLMYGDAGEPVCTHHSFCHVKSLTVMAKSGYEHNKTVQLPRESADGTKHWPCLDVTFAARCDWRASVSGYDFLQFGDTYPTGGALTMLWNSKCGPVVCATTTVYKMLESGNMQMPLTPPTCGTPRLELKDGNGVYLNINDTKSVITSEDDGNTIRINTKGKMKNGEGNTALDAVYEVEYAFGEDFSVTVNCSSDALFIFPLISRHTEKVEINGSTCTVTGEVKKTLTCDGTVTTAFAEDERGFNPIGGFELLPLEIPVSAGKAQKITLSIK